MLKLHTQNPSAIALVEQSLKLDSYIMRLANTLDSEEMSNWPGQTYAIIIDLFTGINLSSNAETYNRMMNHYHEAVNLVSKDAEALPKQLTRLGYELYLNKKPLS